MENRKGLIVDANPRPHVLQNVKRTGGSATDQRTMRHASNSMNQQKRPLIEKAFGWIKQPGGIRKTKLRGLWKVGWQFVMTAVAFNLWRMPKLACASMPRAGRHHGRLKSFMHLK